MAPELRRRAEERDPAQLRRDVRQAGAQESVTKLNDQLQSSNKKLRDQLQSSNKKLRDQLESSNKKFKDAVKSAADRRAARADAGAATTSKK